MYLGTNSATDVPSVVADGTNNEKEDYCRPRPLSEVYLVPPVARPVTTLIPTMQTTTIANATAADKSLNLNYSTVPTPMPVMLSPASSITSNGVGLSFQGYMKMHATGNILHFKRSIIDYYQSFYIFYISYFIDIIMYTHIYFSNRNAVD